MDRIDDILSKARRTVDASKWQLPKHTVVLATDVAKKLSSGELSLMLQAEPISRDDTTSVCVADHEFVYGALVISKSRPISLSACRRCITAHGVDDDLRNSMWPRSRRLYAHDVIKVSQLDEPLPWHGSELRYEYQFKRAPSDAEVSSISSNDFANAGIIHATADWLCKPVQEAVEQTMRLSRPEGSTATVLSSTCSLLNSLSGEFSSMVARREPKVNSAALEGDNMFIVAHKLAREVERALAWLPKRTRVRSLCEDAVDTLEAFAELDSAFVEGQATKSLRDYEDYDIPTDLMKYRPPAGALPTLKMPDPAFNVTRLREKKSTAVLSRIQREARTDVEQFLLNEISDRPEYEKQKIWAVVTLDEAKEYKNLAALEEEKLSGIDPLTRQEFSTESPVFYLGMRLIADFDPPKELRHPVAGRRFGPVISIPEALTKLLGEADDE
jgi:hypothetical protein